MKGWVGVAWLVTYRNKVPPPGVESGHVTYPSTYRARRRVTSLIRPTPLPLRHAVYLIRRTMNHIQKERFAYETFVLKHTTQIAGAIVVYLLYRLLFNCICLFSCAACLPCGLYVLLALIYFFIFNDHLSKAILDPIDRFSPIFHHW